MHLSLVTDKGLSFTMKKNTNDAVSSYTQFKCQTLKYHMKRWLEYIYIHKHIHTYIYFSIISLLKKKVANLLGTA